MNNRKRNERFKNRIKKDIERIKTSEKSKNTLLSQTIYLGAIGIMLALPIIGGAYLGRWLDEKVLGFSFSWTISLIFLGVVIGGINVYFFIKRNEE
ncbi:AtpZ/AtpI family protein [Halobacteriovorax sp. GFR7]|uniref:AtpZ/AtpI family protein n=1 Tax=unclassified Halobacteriovorax TaxID=2639665 RepID=UPI003D98AAD1